MHHRMFLKNLFSAVIVVSISISASAQFEKVETDIKNIIQKYDMVGLSVAVVKKGNMVYAKAFGLKDIASNTPLSDKDIFRIASISKPFSATSIMQLVE